MLTLKHLIWDGDFETIYQAKEVRAKYRERNTSNSPTTLDFVAFDTPSGDVRKLESGTVYVMNDAGKTVSKYEFGGVLEESARKAPIVFTPPSGGVVNFTS